MFIRWWQQYARWWKTAAFYERWAWLSVWIATTLGATYRLIHLRLTMQFLADQGRDVITAYGILHGDIALVGPSTSVGSMFLGPFYYYFMAPWLALANNDPIGPTLAVAFLGVITIPFLFWVGKKIVGTVPALIGTLAFTVAPVAIEYTRFSWNPNPAPFVMLVILLAIWQAWNGRARWWGVVALAWAVMIQLHYVALLSLVPAGIFWLADCVRAHRQQDFARFKALLGWAGAGVLIVALALSPLVVFDIRFQGTISKGFVDFFDGDNSGPKIALSETFLRVLKEQHGRALHTLFEIWGGKDWSAWYRTINTGLLVLFIGTIASALWRTRGTKLQTGIVLLVVSLYTSILGLAWYQSVVFHHYITYLLPVSYLLTGVVIVELRRRLSIVGTILGILLLGYILILGVLPSTLIYLKPLGWTVDHYKSTAVIILDNLPDGVNYGMTHLSDVRDYRGLSYRYFLLTSGNPPVSLENAPNADYMVIVAENPRESREVLGSPVYEVVVFPKGEYYTVEVPDGPLLYFIAREKKDQEEGAPTEVQELE